MEGGITEKLWALYVPLHEYEWRASDGVEPYKTVRTNLLTKSSIYRHCESCGQEIYTIFTQNQKSSDTIIKILRKGCLCLDI